ncbi:MAG TPA: flagellin [Acetobacteraceae bacterium]|nr:flagellin [Acetobacteraceae bacterium]
MSLFSVNTNVGALAALQSLDATQQAMNSAQNEMSTGLKVGSAADNPAIYSIANSINANIAGLSAVSDSLNYGAQVVSTASSAVSNVNTVLQSLQQTVTSSNQSGINLTTLQNQVSAELTSINQFASDATFNGINLLAGNGASGVTSNTLNVVQSVDGSVYTVGNQINPNGGSTNTNLTDALGLSGLNVDTGSGNASVGANISFGTGTTVGSTATPGTFVQATGTNAAIQLTLGTGADGNPQTITFEFVDDSNPQQLQTNPTADNQTVAVNFDSTKDSTNQIVAQLSSALNANGFGVVQQPDGSLNIVGRGLTDASYGTATGGTFTSGSDAVTNGVISSTNAGTASNGVTVGELNTNQTAVTAVQSAVTKLNTISASLGAASQQITGIQNFTTALSSALTAGVGALTDADLAAESAQLSSLQTKQQLATQSLTIANQQPQSLLSLFKNL